MLSQGRQTSIDSDYALTIWIGDQQFQVQASENIPQPLTPDDTFRRCKRYMKQTIASTVKPV